MEIRQTHLRGAPCLLLSTGGASALVALHGAQLLSWQTPDGRERLFLGERARLDGSGAIRGGVPVIFPQFGARGALCRHGFARLRPWRFAGSSDGTARFELEGEAGSAQWPHAFLARLHVTLTPQRLAIALEVVNTGSSAFSFSAALHGYLRVDDLDAASLHGLAGLRWEDSADSGAVYAGSADALRFSGEVDRIYGDLTGTLLLRDGIHALRIGQQGFADAVVWNPGAALAARIDDLAEGEYRRFVCVEAAQVLRPVSLEPDACWRATQWFEPLPGGADGA
ncbi:MAG TPA: D-hexose-6-phosphate mutarotase [Chiayiivirga sp.]|nr:D-hexose-6-phosphate mutarotase [Chiayiivirga sp.]